MWTDLGKQDGAQAYLFHPEGTENVHVVSRTPDEPATSRGSGRGGAGRGDPEAGAAAGSTCPRDPGTWDTTSAVCCGRVFWGLPKPGMRDQAGCQQEAKREGAGVAVV